jgi:hypothetical protein
MREGTLMLVVSDGPVVTVESIPWQGSLLRNFESLTVRPDIRTIQRLNRFGEMLREGCARLA